MAKLGWIGSVALAVGASAGAAAAQFGLGYGLGIISWSPLVSANPPQTPDSVWLSSLAWTAWIAATSTAIGAIAADRRSAGERGSAPPRPGHESAAKPGVFATSIWRTLLAVSAAVGALLAVALVLVPARAAIRLDTSTPQFIAAAYAIVGILVGIIIAICALFSRAGAWNVLVSAAWLWLLAIGSVVDGVITGRGLATAPLGSWPFHDSYVRSTWSLPGLLLMCGSALIIGVAVAAPSARRGDHRLATSSSGILGPAMVAVAYLVAEPGLGRVDDPQVSAAVLAWPAILVGLLGSVLVVALFSARTKLAAERKAANTFDISWASPDAGGTQTATSGEAIGRAKPASGPAPLKDETTAPIVNQRTSDETTAPSPVAAAAGSKPHPRRGRR